MHSGLERFDKVFYILIRTLNFGCATVIGNLWRRQVRLMPPQRRGKIFTAVPRLNDAPSPPDGKSEAGRTLKFKQRMLIRCC